MTPEQQRIAIAEACGWKITGSFANHPVGDPPNAKDNYGRIIPNYINDLNAMHEAEKHLRSLGPLNEFNEFDYKLREIMDRDHELVWHAEAPQRAEAFLKTLNLWTP